jgi:hypothetical protein
LIDLVVSALNVSNKDDFDNWHTKAQACSKQNELIKQKKAWQQFVVHVADERGDPISDFYIQLFTKKRDRDTAPLEDSEVEIDVHTYTKDPSYRCVHLNLSDLGFNEQRQVQLDNLHLRIIASSGSEYVGYYGFGSEKVSDNAQSIDRTKTWDAQLDISSLLNHSEVRLFHPFTTTLIEIRLNREPLPLDRSSPNEVCWFLDKKPSRG